MAPTRDPNASDEWAQAIHETNDELLPAVVGERGLVSLRDGGSRLALRDVVLGVIDATVTTLRGSVGIPSWDRSAIVDVSLETTWRAWTLAGRGLATAEQVAAPAVRLVADPPFLPRSWRPATIASGAARSWRERRDDVQLAAGDAKDVVVTTSIDMAMDSLDLTDLVLTQVDLREIVDSVLAQLDLTQVVLSGVDLEVLANAVVDTVDIDQIAREKMDLLGIANYVIDGIDLPGIIRESTGSVASETIQSVRMQSIDADVAVQRIVDRLLLRRKHHHVEPAPPADTGGVE